MDNPDEFRFQIPVATGGGSSRGGAGPYGGAGEGGEVPDTPLPQCPDLDVPKDILRPTCATALCHDADGESLSGGLRLDGDEPWEELLGVAVETEACRDAGWTLRVDPEGPGASGLMRHLIEEANPDCSKRMPSGAEPLSAYEIECVRRWLENVTYERAREDN